jgi:hypothetical protein
MDASTATGDPAGGLVRPSLASRITRRAQRCARTLAATALTYGLRRGMPGPRPGERRPAVDPDQLVEEPHAAALGPLGAPLLELSTDGGREGRGRMGVEDIEQERLAAGVDRAVEAVHGARTEEQQPDRRRHRAPAGHQLGVVERARPMVAAHHQRGPAQHPHGEPVRATALGAQARERLVAVKRQPQ